MRKGYKRSTQEQRDEAVGLVQELMREQTLARSRAASIVARSMGFSRSAVIVWCDDAGVHVADESPESRALQVELEATRLVNRRLTEVLGDA